MLLKRIALVAALVVSLATSAYAQPSKTLAVKDTGSPSVVALDGKDLVLGTEDTASPGSVYIQSDGTTIIDVDSSGAAITGTLSVTGSLGDITVDSITAGDTLLTILGAASGDILIETAANSGSDVIVELGHATNSRFEIRNAADTIGLAFDSAGDMYFALASPEIIGGSTDLTFRNNADSADNLVIADAGAVSLRTTLQAGGVAALDSTLLTATVAQPIGAFYGDSDSAHNLAIISDGDDSTGTVISSFSTDATGTAPTSAVDSGEVLARFNAYGADGDSYALGGYWQFGVDAGTGDGDMPGNFKVYLSANGSETPALVLNLDSAKGATFEGTVRSSATGTLGWSVVAFGSTSCTNTCTSACVAGFDAGGPAMVDCSSADAEQCLCAGAS